MTTSLEILFGRDSEATETETVEETVTTEQEVAQPEQEAAPQVETGVEASQVAAETETAAEPSEVTGLKAAAAAERKKRQEIEQELAQVRQMLAQQPPPQEEEKPFLGDEYEQRFTETKTEFQQALTQQKLELSEAIARERYEDFDAKLDTFKEMLKTDPNLYNRMVGQGNPAGWMYKQASEFEQMQKLKEIGDPVAYANTLKEQLREQIKAELLAEQAAATKAATEAAIRAKLPRTGFAEERSSGTARATVKTFTGPTPLKDLFKR
jgi:hypothetical protein